MADIVITSLVPGHGELMEAAPGPHPVTVRALRVRDAAAIREVLRPDLWVFGNSTAVGHLIRADGVLAVLEESVLPALVNDPFPGVWLDELRRLEAQLENLGGRVGGTFLNFAKYVAKRLKDRGSEIEHERRTAQARSGRIGALRGRVIGLRDTVVTIGDD